MILNRSTAVRSGKGSTRIQSPFFFSSAASRLFRQAALAIFFPDRWARVTDSMVMPVSLDGHAASALGIRFDRARQELQGALWRGHGVTCGGLESRGMPTDLLRARGEDSRVPLDYRHEFMVGKRLAATWYGARGATLETAN